MIREEIEKLISDDAFKTAEDSEAAGRLVARGYAGELYRLTQIFGLDKAAEEAETPVAVDSLDALLKELGVA